MAVNLSATLHLIKQEGNIVYEYNPLHNFRNEDKELEDFSTENLNFTINHPVDLKAQYSYDGSVDLIINDNINPPRLINSRFTTVGNDKYKIIDRNGNSDTNIYDSNEEFELDTSLYKKVVNIPKLEFVRCNFGGQLKVGNYHFYFKYTDGDGNDTDFVAESGLVSVFIGSGAKSANTGIADQNSNKSVQFILTNIDASYAYVKVYFTRSFADYNESHNTQAFVVNKKYIVNNQRSNITITGFEDISQIALSEINSQYDLYTTAKAQAICQNRLFLGNLTKSEIPYQELSDLSLRIYPTIIKEDYEGRDIDENYTTSKGYYQPDYIYNKVGYWPGEYYRFGIVYIMSDNSLSPVFNVRGAYNIDEYTEYTDIPFIESDDKRKYISYSEENFLIEDGTLSYENVKGVIYINPEGDDSTKVYGIKFTCQNGVYEYLNKLKVKGFFFVRQKRIPTILCQAYTTAISQYSHLPGILTNNELVFESFLNNTNDRFKLESSFVKITYDKNNQDCLRGAFCPDFDVNYPYYNQIFTGDTFNCDVLYQTSLNNKPSQDRHYFINKDNITPKFSNFTCKIVAVNDNVSLVGIDNKKWSSKAGNESEAWAFSNLENDDIIMFNEIEDEQNKEPISLIRIKNI